MSFFRMIPEYIARDKRLSRSEKLFYGILWSLMQKEGYCWATNEFLASETEVCISSVRSYIQHFKSLNLIIVEIKQNRFRKIWTPETYSRRSILEKTFGKSGGVIFQGKDIQNSNHSQGNASNTFKESAKVPESWHLGARKLARNIQQEYIPKEKQEKESVGTTPNSMAVSTPSSTLCDFLLKKMKERNPDFKTPNMKRWIADMDSILNRANCSVENVRSVIEWICSREDNFWGNMLLSPKTLDRQFDRAWMQMRTISPDKNNHKFIKSIIEMNPGLEKVVSLYSTHVEITNGSPYPYILEFKDREFQEKFQSNITKMKWRLKWPGI